VRRLTNRPERDPQAVSRFIERFSSVLTDSGMARMPARVFVALLTADSGRQTAAALAETLRVSPAAISGAVRYLVQLSLVTREREPGTRRDIYHVHDDAWYEAMLRREQMLRRWETSLQDGVAALGERTPAGRRIAESLHFVQFLEAEVPDMLKRWDERKQRLHPDGA
jgi:DNA-binding transcriptional regulator GbsR (MarR family)